VVVYKFVHHNLPQASVVLASAVAPSSEFQMLFVISISWSMRHMASGLFDIAIVAFSSYKRVAFL
jgi:hypothetical protein